MLWARTSNLVEAERQVRLVELRTSLLPRKARFASCLQRLVRPEEFAGRGPDPALGGGRLLAGSNKSSELPSSLALRLSAICWENMAFLPDMVLRLSASTPVFFILRDIAKLESLRRADHSCKAEIALIMSNLLPQLDASAEALEKKYPLIRL